MAFEWDAQKAIENLVNHGIPFDYASRVFLDPYCLETVDNREDYGEIRYKIVGMVEDTLLVVIYTVRHDHIRLISARRAEPYERRHYHEI